jgi:hypothetical protein
MVIDELLGPFAASGDMRLLKKPDGGSTVARDDRFRMLEDAMKNAGVDLARWDWTVLRWLADQDVQAAAAVARWVGCARLAGLAAGTGCEP